MRWYEPRVGAGTASGLVGGPDSVAPEGERLVDEGTEVGLIVLDPARGQALTLAASKQSTMIQRLPPILFNSWTGISAGP